MKKDDIYNVIPKSVLKHIFDDFLLGIDSEIHGFYHWCRVLENGLTISKQNSANIKVIIAFSFFHDIKRENENDDPEHGLRGSELLYKYRKQVNLNKEELEKAILACKNHTDVIKSSDLDIGTCWDADRLDLYRVGIYPDKNYLNNEFSKNDDVIDEACDRSKNLEFSEWVMDIYDDLVIPMLENKGC